MMISQAALVGAYAADTDEIKGSFTAADYKFATEANRGGMFEVTLGKLTAANSSYNSVRQFGEQMVKDHGRAGQELAQIATRKGATLPSTLTARQQREIERLNKLSGPEFDKAYMALMVRAHKADEKAFMRASEEAQDPGLKTFAATTLTMVQEHLKMAEELDANLKHELSNK